MYHNRISLLRQVMLARGIDAYIVPTNDPHFSEYVAPHFKCREWLTGFTGSAGTAVVTQHTAAMFTDSRYFIQAEQQLEGSGFELKKEGLPTTPDLPSYLLSVLDPHSVVGIDGSLYSVAAYNTLKTALGHLPIKDVGDLFINLWTDRPPIPTRPAYLFDEKYAGHSAAHKLQTLVKKLAPPPATIYPLAALDEIAWLLNIRGADIAYTPVAMAYAVVDFDAGGVHLFIQKSKLTTADQKVLKQKGVILHEYADYPKQLVTLAQGKIALIHRDKTSITTYNTLQQHAASCQYENPSQGGLALLKATKNVVEIAGTRKAMLHDGVAWIKLWQWLEHEVDSGHIDEWTVGQQIEHLRAQTPEFREPSFAPIVGYAEHGALPHYTAPTQGSSILSRQNMILIDTGGQYLYGTTDITRTLHLGTPTARQKKDYTLVLKGHIQLSMAKFPRGTRGSQLDIVARLPLLKEHINYLHGTGHGIGHFLGVHEGPQSIRPNENPATLEVGMICSNEPGIYRPGSHGVRIENLILTIAGGTSEFGEFYEFETLTLCPYDINCIDTALLLDDEIEFINRYHARVASELSPLLSKDEQRFLKEKTRKISKG